MGVSLSQLILFSFCGLQIYMASLTGGLLNRLLLTIASPKIKSLAKY